MQNIKAAVLAAGKGTRMHTEGITLPKVMRTALGRPLLAYVLDALGFIEPSDCVLVVGYQEEKVMESFPQYAFAHQREQLGTGHAVMCACDVLDGFDGSLLVCCGDMPLISRDTYEQLCREHFESGNACTMLSGSADVYLPYGRILRAPDASWPCRAAAYAGDASRRAASVRRSGSGVSAPKTRVSQPAAASRATPPRAKRSAPDMAQGAGSAKTRSAPVSRAAAVRTGSGSRGGAPRWVRPQLRATAICSAPAARAASSCQAWPL